MLSFALPLAYQDETYPSMNFITLSIPRCCQLQLEVALVFCLVLGIVEMLPIAGFAECL